MRYLLLVLSSLLLHTVSNAQAGSLDLTFDPAAGTEDYVYCSAVQSDGKLIIGGEFSTYNGTAVGHIARLNTDGTLDTSFDPGTGFNAAVYNIAIQDDGKIVCGGGYQSINGTASKAIARLNSDGTHDTSFDPGEGINGVVHTVSIQTDGKLIIGGTFSLYDGVGRKSIARANSNGTLDTSFDPGTGISPHVYTSSIQADGKIILGGDFASYNGTTRENIVRVNTDGTIDTSFDPGAGPNGNVRSSAIQSDGQILLGGAFYEYDGSTALKIVRINTDGTLDATFDTSTGASSEVRSMAIQNDGKVVIAGYFQTYNTISRKRVARLNTDGTLDTSFDPGTGANNSLYTCALRGDGRIYIGGSLTDYNGVERIRVAKLNGSGLAIPKIEISDLVSVYPNPIKEYFIIKAPNSEKMTINVYNTLGEEVRSNIPATNGKIIALKELDKGAYILEIHLKEAVVRKNIVVN